MIDFKKEKNEKEENNVLDTAGGEMPDANRKLGEKASDAASVFKQQQQSQGQQSQRSDIKQQQPPTAKKTT